MVDMHIIQILISIIMVTIIVTMKHQIMEEQYMQNEGQTYISIYIPHLITLLIEMVEHFIWTIHVLVLIINP